MSRLTYLFDFNSMFLVSRKRKLESGGVMKENGFSVDAQFDQAEEFHVLVEDGNTFMNSFNHC